MRAAKVDSNQREIVQALRSMGASVQPLHTVGQGVPDLLCAISGINFLVEVKDGAKPPSAQKLTPDQIDWHCQWRAPVYIVNSIHQVVDLVQKLKGEQS
jgi:Holliday junction resolvase